MSVEQLLRKQGLVLTSNSMSSHCPPFLLVSSIYHKGVLFINVMANLILFETSFVGI